MNLAAATPGRTWRAPRPVTVAVVMLAACRGGPPIGDAGSGPQPFDVGPAVTLRCGAPVPSACKVVETASELMALQARLEPVLAGQLPACDFRVSRLVAAWLCGPGVAAPVATRVHSEEGVDVVELAPAVTGGGERTLLHAFVVPLRPGQLAVVARLPVDGQLTETTLAVFAGR